MAVDGKPNRDIFHLTVRILLGGIFLYAAIPKILAPGEFYLNIIGYHIITGFPARLTALWLPWVELLTAIGVIFGIWYLASLRLIQAMLVVFIVIMVTALVRGISTDCGCFGSLGGSVTWWHVIGDIVLLLLITFLASWTRFQASASPESH